MMKQLLAFLFLASVPVSAYGDDDLSQDLVRPLERLAQGIRSLSFVEDVRWENSWKGKPPKIQHYTTHVHFRRDLGKLRREGKRPLSDLQGQPQLARAAKNEKHVMVAVTAGSEPISLFKLHQTFRGAKVTVRREGRTTVAEVKKPQKKKQSPLFKVIFNRDRLPVKLLTFGVQHKVLDEITVQWQRHGKHWFPSTIVTVYHSQQNTLTETTRYRSVVINPVLSATLFESP